MTLRAYREGDELSMALTPESEAAYNDDIKDSLDRLRYDETYTCLDKNNKVCGIGSLQWQGDKTYCVWALFDKDRGYKALRDFKRIVDFYVERGNILYTISSESEMQTRMHKFIGFNEQELMGDKRVWVKSLTRYLSQ